MTGGKCCLQKLTDFVCVCVCISFPLKKKKKKKVAEVTSQDHGRWNSSHLQSHPRGFWELHLHAHQWPADPTYSLRQPHRDASVSVFSSFFFSVFLNIHKHTSFLGTKTFIKGTFIYPISKKLGHW